MRVGGPAGGGLFGGIGRRGKIVTWGAGYGGGVRWFEDSVVRTAGRICKGLDDLNGPYASKLANVVGFMWAEPRSSDI